MTPSRRAVITGIGVVSAAGIGSEAFFRGLRSEPPAPPLVVDDFDPSPFFESPKEVRRHDRFAQFALAAAAEALEQAGDLQCDPDRIGVHIGTGVGGLSSIESQVLVNEKNPRRVSPFLVPMMMPNAGSAAVSMRYGFTGPCETTTTACAAGTQSIGSAFNTIRSGRCDVMVAGGSEASNTPTGTQSFINMTATSSVGISRPFDLERDGFLHAEGSAVIVMEEREHALERGANILAEVIGYATNADAHHITAPSPGGVGATACMEQALADAGIAASEVAYINAHGTSTPLNDANEAEAIVKVFGTPGPAVVSTKGVTGHPLGAAGAMEAVAVSLSMQHRLLPPTANYRTPDPDMAPIRVVAEEQSWEPGISLSNSFGFGGHNATLVFAPPS